MSFKELRARGAATLAAGKPVEIPPPEYVGGAAPTRTLRTEGVNRIEQAEARVAELQAELDKRPPVEVALDQLDSVPGRRRKLSAEQYAELLENLRVNPLVHPITVRPKPGGRFEVVSGENRLAVYRELGKATIRVSVLDVGEQLAERAAFYANLIAHDLPDYEKFRGFEREQKATGASIAEMARLAGVPRTTINKLFSFARLPAEALAEIERHPERIGANCADELAKVCTPETAAQVTEAVRLVVEGRIPQQQAVRRVRSVPRAPRPAAAPLQIKAGRFKFAELRVVGSTLRVDLASELDAAEAAKRIEAVLQELARKAAAAVT
ncbi:ParB/RepB/Spo0J family partition protein [Azohydromonas aeria]|uniref:ParB/RepB/Spo0J family partition protein n=1 Tax=Azohydromonas aeria TaxID=2590212 RepID=UPI0012F75AAE|nr:ParB N-terminal domain-containing protein [Azohydromonas aeria]